MSPQSNTQYISPEDYLALEEVAEVRSEYHNGEIRPATGGTAEHNQIVVNLVTLLRSQLRTRNFRIYANDMRLWIPCYRQYTYPDVTIVDGNPIFEGDTKTSVTNSSSNTIPMLPNMPKQKKVGC